MRCKGCNKLMPLEIEMRRKPDGSMEDLCLDCLIEAEILFSLEEAIVDRYLEETEDEQ